MTESAWIFTPLQNYQPPSQLLPEIKDWKTGIKALDTLINPPPAPLLQGERKCPCVRFPQAVIGLSGNAGRLLHLWAKEHGVQVLNPPPVGALLDGTAELWPELRNPSGNIFVIPELERCFLRHYRGIRLTRQLVENVWGKSSHLIIGCDAWGWKYLRQAVQIDALFPDAITAAPLMAHPVDSGTTPDIAPRDNNLRVQAYVLHTLLVHDGVSNAVLPQLLPFRTTQTFKTLSDLRAQQLAYEEDGVWRVVPAHYAGIRGQLAAAEFWTSEI